MYKAPKLYLPVFSLVNLFLSRMSSHLPKQELCKVDFMNKTVLDDNFHTYVSTPSSAIVVHFVYLLDLLFKRLKDILQVFFMFGSIVLFKSTHKSLIFKTLANK